MTCFKPDLKGWHPRKVVQTSALREQKARSMDARFEWWEDLLQSGFLPIAPDASGRVSATMLFEHARTSTPRLKDISATAFGRFLRERGCEGFHTKHRQYVANAVTLMTLERLGSNGTAVGHGVTT